MTIGENKAIIRRYMEEVWNQGKTEVISEFIAPKYVGHVPRTGGDIEGVAAFRDWLSSNRNAFPDIHFKIESQIAEKDMVVTLWTLTGTHEGEFMGVAATGKELRIPGASVTRLAGGKLVENWGYWDRLSAFQQLGVIRL